MHGRDLLISIKAGLAVRRKCCAGDLHQEDSNSRWETPRLRSMTMRRVQRQNLEIPRVHVPGIASGAIASGAMAIGALTIGALPIGRLSICRGEAQKLHFGEVGIEELTVGRLHVIEATGDEAERRVQELRDD